MHIKSQPLASTQGEQPRPLTVQSSYVIGVALFTGPFPVSFCMHCKQADTRAFFIDCLWYLQENTALPIHSDQFIWLVQGTKTSPIFRIVLQVLLMRSHKASILPVRRLAYYMLQCHDGLPWQLRKVQELMHIHSRRRSLGLVTWRLSDCTTVMKNRNPVIDTQCV